LGTGWKNASMVMPPISIQAKSSLPRVRATASPSACARPFFFASSAVCFGSRPGWLAAWPSTFRPQQSAAPAGVSPQVREGPALIWTKGPVWPVAVLLLLP